MEEKRKYHETLTAAIHRLEADLLEIELADATADNRKRIILDEIGLLQRRKNINAAFQRALTTTHA